MCLAIPLRVLRVEDAVAWVEERGTERAISLLGVDGVQPGDYIYAHAGLALERLDPVFAQDVLAALTELAALAAEEDA